MTTDINTTELGYANWSAPARRENETAWVDSVENALCNARYHLEQAIDAAKAASAICTNAEQDGDTVLGNASFDVDRFPSDLSMEMRSIDNLVATVLRARQFYIKTGEVL